MIRFLLLILLLASCAKQPQQVERTGGALQDLPNKVQVITSASYKEQSEEVVYARGKQDKAAPSVSFITPVNGASVNGLTNISIAASDNVGVASVSISINNSIVSRSYNYQWDANASGVYYLTATATDAAGNRRSVTITVTVNVIVVDTVINTTEVSLVMPPVGNQGSEGSCVAFAVAYAARSVDWYYKTSVSSYSYSANIFSPEYVYNQAKFGADCNSGTAMQTGLELMMKQGVCTYQSMPYNSNDCSTQPNSLQQAEAANYKIDSFFKMYCTDKEMIKLMVNNKKAVIINVIADNSFINAKPGFIWRTYSGSGSLPHCIVICGYDDAKNGYKVFNSWGTGWGDAGYGWIDYDFFITRTGTYCYAIK